MNVVVPALRDGEKMMVARRRVNKTQLEVRGAEGNQRLVSDYETGSREIPADFPGPVAGWRELTPTPGELCTVVRRRLGWTLQDAARLVRKSKITVIKIERGDWEAGYYLEALLGVYSRADSR